MARVSVAPIDNAAKQSCHLPVYFALICFTPVYSAPGSPNRQVNPPSSLLLARPIHTLVRLPSQPPVFELGAFPREESEVVKIHSVPAEWAADQILSQTLSLTWKQKIRPDELRRSQ